MTTWPITTTCRACLLLYWCLLHKPASLASLPATLKKTYYNYIGWFCYTVHRALADEHRCIFRSHVPSLIAYKKHCIARNSHHLPFLCHIWGWSCVCSTLSTSSLSFCQCRGLDWQSFLFIGYAVANLSFPWFDSCPSHCEPRWHTFSVRLQPDCVCSLINTCSHHKMCNGLTNAICNRTL